MRDNRQRPRQAAQRKSLTQDGASLEESLQRADPITPDTLDIAVRAYAERIGGRKRSRSNWKAAQSSYWTLVFDAETTTDPSQRLRFGTFQVYNRDVLEKDEHGIFFVPDDPEALSPADLETIRSYASEHDLLLLTVHEFVGRIFYEVGYVRRGTIVGFNLPFDISRLSIKENPARANTFTVPDDPEIKITNRSMVGGFTFKLSKRQWPNARIKHRSSRDAFFQFVNTRKGKRARRGHFIDVKTIAGALLGKSFSLKSLAKELGIEHQKLRELKHGEEVTTRYLDYAVRDTVATWECYRQLRDRFQGYGLTKTPLNTLHTEASIGKAYLKQMGVRPWMDVQPDFSRELLGHVMSSYFGGRSEVHIRRKVTRILYCDFLSMYPTVSVLMRLWNHVRADGIKALEATEEIASRLDRVTLTDLQRPEFWPCLTALVLVEPTDDIFPVRSKYAVGDEQYRLALNRLTSKTPLWFTLADCIASKLLTGRAPKVLMAYRFQPGPTQSGLTPINIAGNPAYRVDPAQEDFYKRLIDLRREIQAREKKADGAQRAVFKHEQLAVKNVANATTYGIFIELNVGDERTTSTGTCFGSGEPFPVETSKFEDPGAFFHPLVAVFTTAAARLMLATAERLAIDAGLDWAFCDTDSMAIAKPENVPEAEFLRRAEGIRNWFTGLNPYLEKGPVFKIEDENYGLKDGNLTKELKPLFCYAISPKRYVLFNLDRKGRPVIRKALAHGLGHLLPPLEKDRVPDTIPRPVVSLEDMDIKPWQYSLWYRIVEAVLSGHADRPKIDDLPGSRRPAATRYGASTPSVLAWCTGYNNTREHRDRIRPFNFMLRFYARLPIGGRLIDENEPSATAHVRSKGPKQLRPIAPFSKNPVKAAAQCFDRATGGPQHGQN